MIALTNESLANQLTEDGGSLDVDDNRPEYQLTGYSFYDEAGHIVSVDNDMLDRLENRSKIFPKLQSAAFLTV